MGYMVVQDEKKNRIIKTRYNECGQKKLVHDLERRNSNWVASVAGGIAAGVALLVAEGLIADVSC